MIHLESAVKTLESRQEPAYNLLNDFTNLSPLAARPEISNWEASADACSFEVAQVGKVQLHFVEREPAKTLKAQGESNDIGFNLWIQFTTDSTGKTRMKLTLKAEIPGMMRSMAEGPMQHFLDLLAESLTERVNANGGG